MHPTYKALLDAKFEICVDVGSEFDRYKVNITARNRSDNIPISIRSTGVSINNAFDELEPLVRTTLKGLAGDATTKGPESDIPLCPYRALIYATIEPNTDRATAKEQPLKFVPLPDGRTIPLDLPGAVERADDAIKTQSAAIIDVAMQAASEPKIEDDTRRRLYLFLRSHGNSAHSLSMLINAGIITAEEARAAAGLQPLPKAA